MGAVRMRVQTADKKHHNNPHHFLWSEKLHVCKKQIHQDVFNFKLSCLVKYVHDIAFSSENVASSESGEKSNIVYKQQE